MPHDAGTARTDSGAKPLTKWQLLAFAIPAIPISAMGLPLVVYLPPFYAELGLGTAVVGSLFMFARFWDVFTDPVLGILSDRFETRWGRRRHWIVLSVPIMLVSVVMIFMPPAGVSATYLITWLFIMYVGWTLLTISHMSWGAELHGDYHERSRVQGAREVALVGGMVLVLAMPIFIEQMGGIDESVRNAMRVEAMGWFVLILLPLTVLIAVISLPERKTPTPKHVPFREAVQVVLRNMPLRTILFADLISGISGGIVASLFIFLARDVLQLGAFTSALLLCYFISGLCFVPAVLWLSRKVGKHRAAALSSLFNTVTVPAILFIPPAQPLIALATWVLLGVNMAAGAFLFRAIMADVADHDEVQTHQQRTGLFYSLLTSTNKIGAAIAIGISYWALDLIGFVPLGENSQWALDALRAIYVWPVVVITAVVAWLLWRFPLDEKAQRENRRIIEMRAIDVAAAGVSSRTLQPSDPQSSNVSAD